MSRKSIKCTIETYQKARLNFIQTISDYTKQKTSLDILNELDAFNLVLPLLNDPVQSIKFVTLNTIAKVVCNMDDQHTDLKNKIRGEVIPSLLKDLEQQNRHCKIAALQILKCITQRDMALAKVIIELHGLPILTSCLEDFDKAVKENAAMVMGSIAKSDRCMAQHVINAGAVPFLVQLLEYPNVSSKLAATFALDKLCNHAIDLAAPILDCNILPLLVKNLTVSNDKLKQETLACLANIAKLSAPIAAKIASYNVIPTIIQCLAHSAEPIQKFAACVLRDISRHNLRLANLVVQAGGIPRMLNFIESSKALTALPAIMAIGYIGAQSEDFAMLAIETNALKVLSKVLESEQQEFVLATTAWSLSQLGKHNTEHAEKVAEEDILSMFLTLMNENFRSENLKVKCKNAFNMILSKIQNYDVLADLFLLDIPDETLPTILCQFIRILPYDPVARRMFVTSGCLKKVQEVNSSDLKYQVDTVNMCFPPEVVQYVSPGYPDEIIDRVDKFVPERNLGAGCDISVSSISVPTVASNDFRAE